MNLKGTAEEVGNTTNYNKYYVLKPEGAVFHFSYDGNMNTVTYKRLLRIIWYQKSNSILPLLF